MEAGLFTANNVWMMICTGLVFFMHLGFSFLEIGLTREKKYNQYLIQKYFYYLYRVINVLYRRF